MASTTPEDSAVYASPKLIVWPFAPSASKVSTHIASGGMRMFSPCMSSGVRSGRSASVWRTPNSQLAARTLTPACSSFCF